MARKAELPKPKFVPKLPTLTITETVKLQLDSDFTAYGHTYAQNAELSDLQELVRAAEDKFGRSAETSVKLENGSLTISTTKVAF